MKRLATNDELLHALRFELKGNRPVRFRHFIRECYSPRTRNGVTHRRYSKSKIRLVDGRPHVMHQGELTALIATWQDSDVAGVAFEQPIVWDVRVEGLT